METRTTAPPCMCWLRAVVALTAASVSRAGLAFSISFQQMRRRHGRIHIGGMSHRRRIAPPYTNT